LKFQQCTGPVMAKGMEDTVFYIYNRLAALDEVGGEPQRFGVSIASFHERNREMQRDWPATLLATSTHDTKRSEDVRARMVAISEIPEAWRQALPRWRSLNRRAKRTLDDIQAPDANEEYLLYQTLLGTWPMDSLGVPEQAASAEYVERIQIYMAKALREAKLNTSWIQPNEQWDRAMSDFVSKIMENSPRNKFLPALLPLAQDIARLGAINSLAQTLLKLTAPGVPDIYQGNEIWDFSLVDPDNRRPVDYAQRRQMLEELPAASPEELMRSWPDGRIKLFLTQRLLQFRREHAELFARGSYLPLETSGIFADCCIAFAREFERHWIIVIAPRLSSRVGFPPIGELWQDTAVKLPDWVSSDAGIEIFSRRPLRANELILETAEATAVLPFAVYAN
jgi:(1->4)-alpha-D-glucan 1-alpha-D-glucosylmutase